MGREGKEDSKGNRNSRGQTGEGNDESKHRGRRRKVGSKVGREAGCGKGKLRGKRREENRGYKENIAVLQGCMSY